MSKHKNGQEAIRNAAARKSRAAKPFRDSADPGLPEAHGLFDPTLQKDSCGVGFVANIKGRKSHRIIEDGLRILCNLEHRGAVGADPRMGDGAGILVQIPHTFFAKKAKELGFTLPAPGQYASDEIAGAQALGDRERRHLLALVQPMFPGQAGSRTANVEEIALLRRHRTCRP